MYGIRTFGSAELDLPPHCDLHVVTKQRYSLIPFLSRSKNTQNLSIPFHPTDTERPNPSDIGRTQLRHLSAIDFSTLLALQPNGIPGKGLERPGGCWPPGASNFAPRSTRLPPS